MRACVCVVGLYARVRVTNTAQHIAADILPAHSKVEDRCRCLQYGVNACGATPLSATNQKPKPGLLSSTSLQL